MVALQPDDLESYPSSAVLLCGPRPVTELLGAS